MDQAPSFTEPRPSMRLALALVALTGAIISYFTFADFLFEDSYITLRYATQLAAGHGLVFQPGERVFGTSAPLWALVLALPIRLGAPPELVLDVAFCASLAALSYAGGRLLHRLGSTGAGFAFAVAITLGVTRLHAYWGMETPLFTALVLGAWCLVLDARYTLAGIALGLACVARYEGYAFGAALALVLAARRAWDPLRRGAIAFACVTLPWLLTASLYYGALLPLPATAKAAHVTSLRYLERSYLDLPFDLFWPWEGAEYRYPVGFALAVAIGVFGLFGLWHVVQRRAALPRALATALPLGALLVFAVLVYFAPGPLCTWHRAPLQCIALLHALLGAALVLRPVLPRSPRLAAVAVIGALVAAVPIHDSASYQLRNTFQYVGREVAYPELADFLRTTHLNEATVLTWEPGYLAFMSDIRVIDVAGLVTPAPDFTTANTARWDHGFPQEADLVLLRAPFVPEGFVRIFEGSMGSWLFARPEVAARYAEAIAAYRAQDSSEPGIPKLSAGPLRITPSYFGAPFVMGPPGTPTRIGPDQEMLAITAETTLVWLDTPRMEVEFSTSTPELVEVQLVVRGEVVLTSRNDRSRAPGVVAWDVRRWLDRTAKVRVLAAVGSGAEASFGVARVAP